MATVKDFSVEEKLSAVLELQKIDSKVDEIKTLKGELPMEVKDLEDEIEGLKTRLSNVNAEIDSISSFVQQKNDNKKDALAQMKKLEKQQENVKNNREFEAINKEVEYQELEVQVADKHMRDAELELGGRIDVRTRTEAKINNLTEALEAKKNELEKIIAETEKEEAALTRESDKAKEHVDARLLSAYERIRDSYSNGLAVVPIVRDSCGGCYNVIPPQRQSEIRQRKKIIVCEHCGRILVDSELNNPTEDGME
jgi:predicted  nucleic acid-binding Zn-ribbon protein